jgi:stage II sporulation protein D
MVLWLRNKLSTCPVLNGLVKGLRHYWLWSCSVGFACILLLVVLFHGCEQRSTVRPTPQTEVDAQFWVRVLLATNVTECSVASQSAMDVLRSDRSPGVQIPVAGPPGHTMRISLSGGQLVLGDASPAAREIILSPQEPHIITFDGRDYRGRLQLSINPGGQGFSVINLVPLEPYLAGVVGEEMPDYWEPEALKAQAIAARTYCLYVKNRFGAGRNWDVSSTQASQVYGGIQAESIPVWDAVDSTYGKVLTSTGTGLAARAGSNLVGRDLLPAYYSSVCGGHTADSEDVFGDSFGPLKGVPCPYCKDVAKLGLFFWPMAQFDRATVTKQLVGRYPKLTALGEIKDIVAVEKRDYGQFTRLTKVKLIGSTGRTDMLRAEDLRLAIDPTGQKIKSTICHIASWGDGWAFLSGRGWGHGVGMCQCGAEGLARLGRTAEEILQYYYPGSQIVNIY